MDMVDAWFDHMARVSHCRTLKAERLAAREKGGIVLCATRHDGSVNGAMVSPSPDKPGKWRITWFDVQGFSGDGTRDTKAECIRECLVDGYHDTNRNLLREYSRLASFHEGNERTTAMACAHAAMRLTNAQAARLCRSSLPSY